MVILLFVFEVFFNVSMNESSLSNAYEHNYLSIEYQQLFARFRDISLRASYESARFE